MISINGKIIDEKKASIPINGNAFLFGMAVFETLRTYNHQIFRLHDHLDRLFLSANEIGIKPKWNLVRVEQEVLDAVKKDKNPDIRIRIILTQQEVIIMTEPLKEKPKSFYQKGVKAISCIGRRNLPNAKILGDTFLFLAKQQAEEKGVYESLLVEPVTEWVREGSYSNIFWVKNNQLLTVGDRVLKGITRDTVIRLAKKDHPCRLQNITLKNLLKADEVFITQTTSGILPVIEIDKKIIGSGKPGPITKKLMWAFDRLTKKK